MQRMMTMATDRRVTTVQDLETNVLYLDIKVGQQEAADGMHTISRARQASLISRSESTVRRRCKDIAGLLVKHNWVEMVIHSAREARQYLYRGGFCRLMSLDVWGNKELFDLDELTHRRDEDMMPMLDWLMETDQTGKKWYVRARRANSYQVV